MAWHGIASQMASSAGPYSLASPVILNTLWTPQSVAARAYELELDWYASHVWFWTSIHSITTQDQILVLQSTKMITAGLPVTNKQEKKNQGCLRGQLSAQLPFSLSLPSPKVPIPHPYCQSVYSSSSYLPAPLSTPRITTNRPDPFFYFLPHDQHPDTQPCPSALRQPASLTPSLHHPCSISHLQTPTPDEPSQPRCTCFALRWDDATVVRSRKPSNHRTWWPTARSSSAATGVDWGLPSDVALSMSALAPGLAELVHEAAAGGGRRACRSAGVVEAGKLADGMAGFLCCTFFLFCLARLLI
ncbi:hypothetical protein IWX49DRAFT_248962 [Phyllosticta citricarpa]|uniref:Uncharacterized protein n=2 Tax=Phyllosticta TaxID=121621 RepID=A0ABR1MFK1_9PEZI